MSQKNLEKCMWNKNTKPRNMENRKTGVLLGNKMKPGAFMCALYRVQFLRNTTVSHLVRVSPTCSGPTLTFPREHSASGLTGKLKGIFLS